MNRAEYFAYCTMPWLQVAACSVIMCGYILWAWGAATAKEFVSWSAQHGVGGGCGHRAGVAR